MAVSSSSPAWIQDKGKGKGKAQMFGRGGNHQRNKYMGRGRGKGKGGAWKTSAQGPRCWVCGKVGHKKAACRQQRRLDEKGVSSSNSHSAAKRQKIEEALRDKYTVVFNFS